MRRERFYHSAPSAADSHLDSPQTFGVGGSFVAPLAQAFPQGLEAAAYALRKRVICPRWWLIGVMSQWLLKDSELLTLELSIEEDDWVLSGPSITPKNFPLVVLLWTELFAQVSRTEFSDHFTVELDLTRILRGTSSEVQAQREFLTEYLSSALRVQRARSVSSKQQTRRAKNPGNVSQQLALDSVGLVQIVENVVVKQRMPETLLVTFTRDPRRLFTLDAEELLPPALRHTASAQTVQPEFGTLGKLSASLVSLQPDVLQALSRTVSPKKLCSYLSLELMKKDTGLESESDAEQVWRGRALAQRELSRLHKEQLARAQSFYDHGILSWENEAPKQRVRQLVNRGPKLADSGIVHCWRMSQHALEAVQFEHALASIMQKSQDAVGTLTSSATGRVGLTAANVQTGLRAEVQNSDVGLRAEVQNSDVGLRAEVQNSDVVLRSEVSVAAASRRPDVPVSTSPRSEVSVETSAVSLPQMKPVLPRSERIVPMAESVPLEQDLVQRKTSSKTVVRSNAPENSAKREFLNDDDFLMCVAAFYESLTPVQQQAFERERKKMSPEQFKKYVTPALMRIRLRD